MDFVTDCYDCILGSLTALARRATRDEEKRREIIHATLNALLKTGGHITPPEFAGEVHRILRTFTHETDHYAAEKHASTRLALELAPQMLETVRRHPRPFDALVRLAIGGNIIDYGADRDFTLEKARKGLTEVFDLELEPARVDKLENAMRDAKKIFYIADNCGEAVFDAFLIDRFRDRITLGVRGKPILNDITPAEVAESGLDIVPVIDTGDDSPGVAYRRTAQKFIDAVESSDLVIAKGQGNFETLEWVTRPIAYLLRVKCPVIASRLGGAVMGSLQIQFRNF